jgi:hypothetical protein
LTKLSEITHKVKKKMHFILKYLYQAHVTDELVQLQTKSIYANETDDANAGARIIGGDAFAYTTPNGFEQIVIYEVEDARIEEFMEGIVKRMNIYKNVKDFNWTITVAVPSMKSARWLGLIPE